MWSATNTTTVSHENGITYGSTTDSNGANGFISFCGSRGVPLSAGITNSPRMSFFKNCINGGNIGTIACRINVEHNGNVEVEGHLMAVQGYTQLKNVNTNQTIETVMVADGWNSDVRYVNLDFPYYVNSVGTIFAR